MRLGIGHFPTTETSRINIMSQTVHVIIMWLLGLEADSGIMLLIDEKKNCYIFNIYIVIIVHAIITAGTTCRLTSRNTVFIMFDNLWKKLGPLLLYFVGEYCYYFILAY